MTCISPVNEKLRSRAVGIVVELGGVSPERAQELLSAHDWDIGSAVALARRDR
jgi:N-acetylmuramic acid 6-phosphate (MurNAc-6-P) etherase